MAATAYRMLKEFTVEDWMRMTVEEFLEIQDILRVTYDLEEPAAGGSRREYRVEDSAVQEQLRLVLIGEPINPLARTRR